MTPKRMKKRKKYESFKWIIIGANGWAVGDEVFCESEKDAKDMVATYKHMFKGNARVCRVLVKEI